MSTGLSLLFTNQLSQPLALVNQSIQGASWNAPPPNELVHGTTGGPFGVAPTDSTYTCEFTYTPDGSHNLQVTIQVTDTGGITITPSQAPPYQVAESPSKQGDTWIVRLYYSED